MAFIYDLGNDTERMDLFLSVASLDPGKNFTIVVPLRTMPDNLAVENMTDKDFLRAHDIDKLQRMKREQEDYDNRFGETLTITAGIMTGAQLSSIVVTGLAVFLWGWVGHMAGGEELYQGQGLSVSMHDFNSSSQFKTFYESLDIPLHEDVQSVAEKYYDYNILVINGTTTPPIEERVYNDLMKLFPDEMIQLSEFVAENPSVNGKGYDIIDLLMDNSKFSKIYENMKKRASNHTLYKEMYDEIFDNSTEWYSHGYYSWYNDFSFMVKHFERLVNTIYGNGELSGYFFSMELPLWKGNMYYPLGTSTAWSNIMQTDVVFIVDEDNEIDFVKGSPLFLWDGKQNYYWYSFTNEAPDYDLEGEVKEGGTSLFFKHASVEFRHVVYKYSIPIALILVVLINSIIWFVAVQFLQSRLDVPGRKKSKKRMYLIALYSSLVSYLFFIAGFSLLLQSITSDKSDKRNRTHQRIFAMFEYKRRLRFSDKIKLSMILLVIPFTFAFYAIINVIQIAIEGFELVMIPGIVLLSTFIGSMLFLPIYIVFNGDVKTKDYRKLKIETGELEVSESLAKFFSGKLRHQYQSEKNTVYFFNRQIAGPFSLTAHKQIIIRYHLSPIDEDAMEITVSYFGFPWNVPKLIDDSISHLKSAIVPKSEQ